MEQELNIRLIKEDETEICNRFHNDYFGTRRTIEQWKWEFVPRILDDHQVIMAVAEDHGRIVGTQALIPIRMIDRNGVFWTGKSEETLVDPSCRGKKMGVAMYHLVFEYAEKHRMRTVWGFTKAINALLRVNFEIAAQTSQLFFPLASRSASVLMALDQKSGLRHIATRWGLNALCATGRVASTACFAVGRRRAMRSKKRNRLTLKTLRTAPEESGELCRMFVDRWGGTTIYRDAAYMNWRIFENPYRKATVRAVFDSDRIVGWAAFVINDDSVAALVDLIAAAPEDSGYSDTDLVQLLLSEVVIGCRSMGALGIRGWSVNEHPFDKLIRSVAKKLGYFHIRRGNAMMVYSVPAGGSNGNDYSHEDWFVTRINTDGVYG